MKKNQIKFKNFFHKNDYDKVFINSKKLKFEKFFKNIFEDLENPKKFFNILSNNYKFSFEIKDLDKFKKFKKIAIIGMGGSILGAEAIYNFLKEKIKKKDIYFFDDINIRKLIDYKKKKNKTLFIIISKSGETIETLSNSLFLNVLKEKKNVIIISEKKNNSLFLLSKKFKLFFVNHKENIGGRYSVLSEVGMIPSYLMGLKIFNLRKNIKKYLFGSGKKYLKESSLIITNFLQRKKISNLIFLNYAPELESFLFWCQQLIAESLGKKKKGFLPVVSNVPKDHHSLLQLYLDGPKDKVFYIFSIKSSQNSNFGSKIFLKNLNYLKNKSLAKIKTAQKNALIESLKRKKISFREIEINSINEETLGELFSYFILETVMIGNLSGINPFDQPSVEEVKVLTKKFLN